MELGSIEEQQNPTKHTAKYKFTTLEVSLHKPVEHNYSITVTPGLYHLTTGNRKMPITPKCLVSLTYEA